MLCFYMWLISKYKFEMKDQAIQVMIQKENYQPLEADKSLGVNCDPLLLHIV